MKQYLFGKGKLHLNLILFSLSLLLCWCCFIFLPNTCKSYSWSLLYSDTWLYSLSNWVCTCLHVICFVSLLSYFCVILVVFSLASFVSLCHLLPLNQLPPLPLISLGVCKCLAFTFKYITFIQYNYILSTLCSRCSCGLLWCLQIFGFPVNIQSSPWVKTLS